MAVVTKPSSVNYPEVFAIRTAYEVIFPRVMDYSKEYGSMRSITVDASNMEGCADVRLPEGHDRGRFIMVYPVFTDTLLHVAGFVANLQGSANDAFICSEVAGVKMVPHLIDNDSSYTIYCSSCWVPEDGMVLADAYTILCGKPTMIVAHIKGMQFRRVQLDRFKRATLGFQTECRPDSPTTVPSGTSTPRTLVTEDASSIQDRQLNVRDVLSSVLCLDTQYIDDDVNLDSLGLDFLTSIEVLHAFRKEFDFEVATNFFTTYRTPRALQTYLALHSSKTAKSIYSDIVHDELPKHAIPRLQRTDAMTRALRLGTNPVPIQPSNS
ncbi:hypothetical protein C0993_005779, partial [Termitomyces sp. T159_Od127]